MKKFLRWWQSFLFSQLRNFVMFDGGCVLSVFCLWLRVFSLTVLWCVGMRASHVRGMNDGGGGMDDISHTQPDISHKDHDGRHEGVGDNMNNLRQGQGRKRPKWLSFEGHQHLCPLFVEYPALSSVYPRTTSDEDKTLTHAPFCCCFCCVPSVNGPSPGNPFDT